MSSCPKLELLGVTGDKATRCSVISPDSYSPVMAPRGTLVFFLLALHLAVAWIGTPQVFRKSSLVQMSAEAGQEQEAPEKSAIRPTKGSVVTVRCRLKPEGEFIPEALIDGIVLHELDDPVEISFVLGMGNYLPGLHKMLEEMQVGDKRTESVDAGWGSHNPDLVATIPFAESGLDPSQIKQGVQLLLQNMMKATVTEVSDTGFTIDANPPLAGASYGASVELVRVEDGPDVFGAIYSDKPATTSRYELATFAMGCFWGGELAFMREPGVVGTGVGYTHGSKENPTYKEVCSGTTGHTESIVVVYDPAQVSYERLVQLAMDRLGENKFLQNQVGNDKGTQYRHGIYYYTPEQGEIAKTIVESYGKDCVTECLPATKFWVAEEYHQQYLLKGGQSARKGDSSTIRCYG